MELKGEYRIAAPRDQVWVMLNDPDVLRECIPGCESLEGSPTEGFSARVTTKVGPVKATFTGSVALTNLNPPESYRISGEGKGGVAGFAKGGADVRLAADGADTLLTYSANAQVGGKLAQLGARLIDSTAKKLADQFFACFAAKAAARAPTIVASEPISPAEAAPPLAEQAGAALDSPGTFQHLAHEVEEEVAREAAIGFLGGPIVWALLVMLALLFVYVIAT
jgi:carbon monoxide dehydrogenase subunit G